MKSVLFLTSGKGKNIALAAAIFYCLKNKIKISVASHSMSSTGELMALKHGLDFYKLNRDKESGKWERDIISVCSKLRPTIVFLLYNRIIPASVLKKADCPFINIHPSLLPAFKGFKAIDAALSHKVKLTGVTAHFADESVDGGEPIIQSVIPLPGTIAKYADIEQQLDRHNSLITLQILDWVLNEDIDVDGYRFYPKNSNYEISEFYPNINQRTFHFYELFMNEYRSDAGYAL